MGPSLTEEATSGSRPGRHAGGALDPAAGLRQNGVVDAEKVIAEFERGAGQKVVVRRTQFKGKEYLDLRQFFQGDEGEWLPTKKGVSLPWDLCATLIEALQKESGE